MGNKYTLEEANLILHSAYPELNLLDYTNSKTLSSIKSDKCGHEWKGSLSNILSGIGGYLCRICTPIKNGKRSLIEVNEILQAKFPDIEITEYNGSNAIANVRSKICGHEWKNRPRNILSGHSGYICRICTPAINSKLTLESANLRLSNISKVLEFVTYNGLQVPSTIRNKVCGHTWETTLNNITTGNTPITCPICVPKFHNISKGEKEVVEYIQSIYSGWLIENDRLNIPPYELDLIIPDLGLAIEYNGLYWHKEDPFRHIDKTIKLKNNSEYQLIHIMEDEWKNKKDIVKSKLLILLNKANKIYARKCTIEEINWPKNFLDSNHLQGSGAPTSINLGLFYNNTLVATMTFSKARFSTKYDYELVRYCSILNTTVVGGASKLFNYFNKYYTGSIVSYSDKRWSSGNLYKILGFEYSHSSDPNYRYYKGNISLSRYQCQKHLLKQKFPTYYEETKTEIEIMQAAGYYRVFDCGNDVWIYNK